MYFRICFPANKQCVCESLLEPEEQSGKHLWEKLVPICNLLSSSETLLYSVKCPARHSSKRNGTWLSCSDFTIEATMWFYKLMFCTDLLLLICMYSYLFKIIITPSSAPAALKNVMLVRYKCCVSFILVLGLQLCWYWTCDYQQLWLNMSRWHTDGSCHHETLLRRLQALQNIDQYESQNWLQDGWYFVDIDTLFYLIFSSFVLVSFFEL